MTTLDGSNMPNTDQMPAIAPNVGTGDTVMGPISELPFDYHGFVYFKDAKGQEMPSFSQFLDFLGIFSP